MASILDYQEDGSEVTKFDQSNTGVQSFTVDPNIFLIVKWFFAEEAMSKVRLKKISICM